MITDWLLNVWFWFRFHTSATFRAYYHTELQSALDVVKEKK